MGGENNVSQQVDTLVHEIVKYISDSVKHGSSDDSDIRFAIQIICLQYKSRSEVGTVSEKQVELILDLSRRISESIFSNKELDWAEIYIHLTRIKEDMIKEGRKGGYKINSLGSTEMNKEHPDELNPIEGPFSGITWNHNEILGIIKESIDEEDLSNEVMCDITDLLNNGVKNADQISTDTSPHPAGPELQIILRDEINAYDFSAFQKVQCLDYLQKWVEWHIFS